jgi:hypothetical protein
MESKLEAIRKRSPGGALDAVYAGYKNELETKVINKLSNDVYLVQ